MTHSTPDTCIFWSCSIKIFVYCSCLKHDFKMLSNLLQENFNTEIFHSKNKSNPSTSKFNNKMSICSNFKSSQTCCKKVTGTKHSELNSLNPGACVWPVVCCVVTSLGENQWSWKKLVMTDILTTFMRDSYSMRQKCWIKLWLIGQMFGGGFRTL